MRSIKQAGLGIVAATSIVASTVVITGTSPVEAALPQPPPAGPELTDFAIDGDTVGPNDWDDPYTAPGTTPIGYQTSGLLPANFFPTFSAPDFPDPSIAPGTVENPAFGVIPGEFEFCFAPQLDDAWTPSAALGEIRLADPVISLPVPGSPNGKQALECANVNNKTDTLEAYAAFEVVQVPNGDGSYPAWVCRGYPYVVDHPELHWENRLGAITASQ